MDSSVANRNTYGYQSTPIVVIGRWPVGEGEQVRAGFLRILEDLKPLKQYSEWPNITAKAHVLHRNFI
jgi:hypothetical protein